MSACLASEAWRSSFLGLASAVVSELREWA